MKKLLSCHKLWFLLFIPIFCALAFIWIDLGVRVIHHDESLHAIYGLYYYINPSLQYYKYNPMLHGPLLYHLMPWIFHLFDESYQSIRILPALFFSIIPFSIAWILHKNEKWLGLTIAAILITGPSYTYWARFLRHDQLVLVLFIPMALAFHKSFKKYAAYLFFIPMSLQFCAKENAFIHLALWFGFFIFNYFINNNDTSLLKVIFKSKKHLVISLLLASFVYTYYYTAGFQYSDGLLDGLYRKSLFYWVNQHHIQRIPGPFLTQFFTLFWYELPFTLLLIFSVLHLHFKSSRVFRFLPLVLIFIAMIFHFIYGFKVPDTSYWSQFAKIKLGMDFYGFFILLVLSVTGTWILIKDKKILMGFFYYWTMASFFTYSFVGEKVPWLSIYILIPGIVFVGLYIWKMRRVELVPILILVLGFNLFQSYQLNHKNAGSATEFIGQVHTTKEYDNISLQLKKLLEKDIGINILAYKENTWPLTWHLYNRKGYYYKLNNKKFDDFDIILDSFPSKSDIINDSDYQEEIVDLRHWWVPDWKSMKLIDLLSYSFTHSPWNDSGAQSVTIFYKDNLLNF